MQTTLLPYNIQV